MEDDRQYLGQVMVFNSVTIQQVTEVKTNKGIFLPGQSFIQTSSVIDLYPRKCSGGASGWLTRQSMQLLILGSEFKPHVGCTNYLK